MNRIKVLWLVLLILSASGAQAQREMEKLSRGLVAVKAAENNVFVSWRLLNSDAKDVSFDLYRNYKGTIEKVNSSPLHAATSFLDTQVKEAGEYQYFIKSTKKGSVEEGHFSFVNYPNGTMKNYFDLPLQTPEGYSPNDASVGDLDGDGEYEIIIHMMGKGRDNSHYGETDAPIFQAYKLDGTLLWTINLGTNIREGSHYNPFLVFDFDQDGKAEMVLKTSDGTVDGLGHVIGDASANYRNAGGHIITGAEYLTMFDGMTGKALQSINYPIPRYASGTVGSPEELKRAWGDNYGNRSERYLACVAYLDGKHPSLVFCRGYYTRVTMGAFQWRNNEFHHDWTFDSDNGEGNNRSIHGEGNHSVSVADVDGDGCDEIIYGAAAINNDGTPLHATGFGHGDALHVSDLDPTHPGLEIMDIQERFSDAGLSFREANSGKVLWKLPSVRSASSGGDKGEGPGRGVAFDIDPRHPGSECWVKGAGIGGLWSAQGEKISENAPRSCNFGIWWDGDLLRELLDSNRIYKWDWESEKQNTIFVADGCRSNNGSKSNPCLSADLFGDWREEVIFRTEDNQSLRIYTTTIPTEHRFISLMQDPVYRLSIAWQNGGYNQPPHVGFYLGAPIAVSKQKSKQSSDVQAVPELYPSGEVISRYHNDWTKGSYRRRIANFQKDPLQMGEVVFIGNSITQQGRDWSERFGMPHIRNRGIAGDLTDGVLHRLDEICYYRPKAVFILIGVNDLFNMHHERDTRFTYDKLVPSTNYIAKNIVKIAKQIARQSPETKIYVRTLLPTRRDFMKEDIVAVNTLIKRYERKAPYEVIDLYAQFVDQDGNLIKEYTKDGVHLTEAGYAHWVSVEKKILEEL